MNLLSQADLYNPAVNASIGKFNSYETNAGISVLNLFVGNFITLAFGLAVIILIFILLWGGYEYITSGGDKEGTQKATKKMTTALIGICLLFSVYAIIAIIEVLFGINLRSIQVPSVNKI